MNIKNTDINLFSPLAYNFTFFKTQYSRVKRVETAYHFHEDTTHDFLEINRDFLKTELFIYWCKYISENYEGILSGIHTLGSDKRSSRCELVFRRNFGLNNFKLTFRDLVRPLKVSKLKDIEDTFEIDFKVGEQFSIPKTIRENDEFISKIASFTKNKSRNKRIELEEFLINNLNLKEKRERALSIIGNLIHEKLYFPIVREYNWISKSDDKKYLGHGFRDIDDEIVKIWDEIEHKIELNLNNEMLNDIQRIEFLNNEFLNIDVKISRIVKNWRNKTSEYGNKIISEIPGKVELYCWASIQSIINEEHGDNSSELSLNIERKVNFLSSNLKSESFDFFSEFYKLFPERNEKAEFDHLKLKLTSIHGDKYSFDFTDFKTLESKIKVKCSFHGLFYSKVSHLLKGYNCPSCAKLSSTDNIYKIEKNISLDLVPTQTFFDSSKSDQEYMSFIQNFTNYNDKIDDLVKSVEAINKNVEEHKEISINGFEKTGHKFNSLFSALDDIKSNVVNNEDSISKVIKLIFERFDKEIKEDDLKKYEKKVKAWLNFWNLLEEESKVFMPGAEFLYNKIKRSSFDDFSPFVLYYCRALEYELFNKIFLGYHDYIEEKYEDKTVLFDYNKTSLSSKAIKEIESGIIQGFKRGVLNNSPKYTLGDMRLLLNLLPSENKTKGSNRFQALLALQELSNFINSEIGQVPSDLIKDIESIITNYRNPSAHTGIINKSMAKLFYEDYKSIMNRLMNILNS